MSMTRVLFVDDEPSVLSALRRSLHKRNLPWRMEFVASGKEALDRLQDSRFDVIVSDLRMPAMSGQELLEHVSREYPQIVQVILSGVGEEELDRDKLNADPQFLSKPCSAEKLIATIQRGIFTREFFRRGALSRLLESFEELSVIPELQIKIRPAECSGQNDPSVIAEIICPDLGFRLQVPVRRTHQQVECVLDGVT